MSAQHIEAADAKSGSSAPAPTKPPEAVQVDAGVKTNSLLATFKDGKPVVAIFSARSCCGAAPLAGVADAMATQYSNTVHVVFVDAFREREIALQCGVETLRTVVIYDAKGAEKARLTEVETLEEVDAKMKELGLK